MMTNQDYKNVGIGALIMMTIAFAVGVLTGYLIN